MKKIRSQIVFDTFQERSSIVKFLESLGEYGCHVASLYILGMHDEITRLSVDPNDFENSEAFFLAYQAYSYLRKYPFLDTKIDREAVALEKFYRSEEVCRRVNASKLNDVIVAKLKTIISQILLPVSVDEIAKGMRFGPGASSSVPRRSANLLGKLRSRCDCTIGAVPLIDRLIGGTALERALFGVDEGPVRRLYNIVDHSKLTFVPKDARSDRSICIEPDLNILAQLGLGNLIEKSLDRAYSRQHGKRISFKKFAPSYNAMRAREGSIDGSFATIDLSMASDTLSLKLLELLPYEYRLAILASRSECVILPDGTSLELSKISSMGNGFTFELETLIFYAVTKLCGSSLGCVFGDDIVIEAEFASQCIEVLESLGFSVNCEKTFTSGPFRESCGKDYYLGRLVRPLFLKQKLDSVPKLITHINAVRRLSIRFGIYCSDSRFRRYWNFLLRRVERALPFVPFTGFDGIDTAVYSPDEKSPRGPAYSCILVKPEKKLRAMQMCECVTHMYFGQPSTLTREGPLYMSTSYGIYSQSWYPWF